MTVSNLAAEKKASQRLAETQLLESATIRFAGDSGDGMQLAGTQFTNASAILGNDISTLPDFPAEIRAPAGTLAGVSGFQVQFSSTDIFTPGDDVDASHGTRLYPYALASEAPVPRLCDMRRAAMKGRVW